MATTYTLISSNILGANASSVTFSSIPSTYTDLEIRISARTSNAGNADGLIGTFNSTSSVYSSVFIQGKYGNNTSSSLVYSNETSLWSNGNLSLDGANNTASIFASVSIYIPNYTSSSNKQITAFTTTETNNGGILNGFITEMANLIRITSALTSVTFTTSNSANFLTGSSFYLYGIKNS